MPYKKHLRQLKCKREEKFFWFSDFLIYDLMFHHNEIEHTSSLVPEIELIHDVLVMLWANTIVQSN